MGCQFGFGKDKNGIEFTFFQCRPHEPYQAEAEKRNLQPYEENECRHDRRFERKGVLTCQDCGMVYNEHTLEWEQDREREF
jgi:hypothetical protein